MTPRACDEFEGGAGWILDEFLGRAWHALVADGGVWLLDPLDLPGVEERVRALGEPRGVIQLIDRHERDCAPLATRLGVPHHVLPFDGVPGSPFEAIPLVRRRFWREVALWWPERRVLAVAEAVGTPSYFRAPGEPVGVHPLLRLRPPRTLAGLEPLHVLCGHGEGLHGAGAAAALDEAIRTARRRLPAAWLAGLRARF